MYTADEKVTTDLGEVRITIKEGQHHLKLRLAGDSGYSVLPMERSEAIELIEKLAKVAEQLPK